MNSFDNLSSPLSTIIRAWLHGMGSSKAGRSQVICRNHTAIEQIPQQQRFRGQNRQYNSTGRQSTAAGGTAVALFLSNIIARCAVNFINLALTSTRITRKICVLSSPPFRTDRWCSNVVLHRHHEPSTTHLRVGTSSRSRFFKRQNEHYLEALLIPGIRNIKVIAYRTETAGEDSRQAKQSSGTEGTVLEAGSKA